MRDDDPMQLRDRSPGAKLVIKLNVTALKKHPSEITSRLAKEGDEVTAGDGLARFAFHRDPAGGEHVGGARLTDRNRYWPKVS